MSAAPNLMRAALDLASKGYLVFPLRPGTKLPFRGSHGFEDASNDPEQLATWWGERPRANVAIATGHGGLFVLDVDVKDGKPGLASLDALIAKTGLDLARCAIVDTPSGGLHLYFRDERLAQLGLSAKWLGDGLDGLDVRGVGGYVVAPPSVIDGKAYSWRAR